MSESKRKPNLVAFIIIGLGMVTVGISTETWGLTVGGIVFIIIGASSVVGSRRAEHTGDDESGHRDDQRRD